MFYKSNSDVQISLPLFGVGRVTIPANASCIELAPGVADAINKMVYPNVVLEEVTPTFSVDENPVATAKKAVSRSARTSPKTPEAVVETLDDVELEEVTLDEDPKPKEEVIHEEDVLPE